MAGPGVTVTLTFTYVKVEPHNPRRTMRRIDDRTVELSDAELKVHEKFTLLRDDHGTPFAAALALNGMYRLTGERPTDDFIEYLSEGTCERWRTRVRIVPMWKRRLREAEAKAAKEQSP